MKPSARHSARPLHGLTLGLLALQLILTAATGQSDPSLLGGGALLVLAAALRLRSSRSTTHWRPIVLAELLTLGLLALQPPALSQPLLQGLSAVLLLAALIRQEAGGTVTLLQVLRRSLQLALAALPLLALAMVLPRWGLLESSLWPHVPSATGRTGLSNVLAPGSLSALQRSTAPALRIRWRRGSPPPPALRYWRVLVLDRFDGRAWSASPMRAPSVQPAAAHATEAPDQLWLAEAMPAAALPWPGRGRPIPGTLQVDRQGMLLAPPTDNTPLRYGISLHKADAPWRWQPPRAEEQVVPPGSNPRLEQLGASWRQRPVAERIQAAAQLFRRQRLRYTTTPAPLPAVAPLDGFLFQTRKGYCEHLASAFTALMRAAGLPARVVVGYQGGRWVAAAPWGPGYLDVRQSEAHAWSEVWIEGRGWQRIDPTAWVAPERFTGAWGWRPATLPWLRLEQAWEQLRLGRSGWRLDEAATGRPRRPPNRPTLEGVLLLGAALVLGACGWVLARPTVHGDRHRRQLERSLAPLRHWDLQPHAGETLPQFCDRAAQALPALGPPLLAIAIGYDQLRFSGRANAAAARSDWLAAKRALAQSLQHQLRRQRQGALQQAHPSSSTPAP